MANQVNIAAFAAQIAAGDGNSALLEFTGDAGELHYRDMQMVDAAPALGSPEEAAASASVSSAKTPKRLRRAVQRQNEDTAVESVPHGVKLRTNVLDSLSLLTTLDEDTTSRMISMQRRFSNANSETFGDLITFDEEFLYTSRVGFGIERLLREALLDIDTPFLESYGVPIVIPDSPKYIACFQDLDQRLLSVEESGQVRDRIRKEFTRPLFPFGDGDIPDLLVNMNMFALTDVLAATKATLTSSQEQVDAVDAEVVALRARYNDILQTSEYEEIERVHLALIGKVGEKIDVLAKRMQLLSGGDNKSNDSSTAGGGGSGNREGGLLTKLDAIMTAPGIQRCAQEKTQLKGRAQSDIQKLELDRVKKLKKNEAAISTYNANVELSRRRIKDNIAEQNETWEAIQELIRKMHGLVDKGDKLTHSHMEMTEVEQKRRKECAEFTESYASHRKVLDEVVVSCDAGLEYLDQSRKFLERGRQKILSMKVEEHLRTLLNAERKLFAATFQAWTEDCVQAVNRCDIHAVTLERSGRDLKFQRAQAHEMEDPQLPLYTKRLVQLEGAQRTMERKRGKLMTDFERREIQFITLDTDARPDEGGDSDQDGDDEGDASDIPDVRMGAGGAGAAAPTDDEFAGAASPASLKSRNPALKARAQLATMRKKIANDAAGLTKSDVSELQHEKKQVEELGSAVDSELSVVKEKKAVKQQRKAASPVKQQQQQEEEQTPQRQENGGL